MSQLTLPPAFIEAQKFILPPEEWTQLEDAILNQKAPVSVRVNQKKVLNKKDEIRNKGEHSSCQGQDPTSPLGGLGGLTPVPWCPQGYYLSERPEFTLDPLLHAGAYYVQEASSMFITHVIRSLVNEPVTALDLCASPGGKTTAMQSALPEGSLVVSNEIDRRRARILSENVTKWGSPDVVVTANAPADFAPLREAFDFILVDAPCSGEGMFRKDPATIGEWSPRKVDECVATQRQILRDIWPALKPGGLLVYSTCTYNVHEDEEMLAYICDELGAQAIEVPTDPDWHIHPPLTGSLPCYRFMPHCTQGEGLFMSVVRKLKTQRRIEKDRVSGGRSPFGHSKGMGLSPVSLPPGYELLSEEGSFHAFPSAYLPLWERIASARLYCLNVGVELASPKGRDLIPAHALALSSLPVIYNKEYVSCEIDLPTALQYLRREAIVLPDAPRGYVRLTYQGLGLGWVKNLGNRANNLYPTEWRIRYK